MARELDLPFPRGTFACDGQITPTGEEFVHLEGMEFTVPNSQHSDDTQVTLIILRNDSGSAITLAHKFYSFNTGSKDWGRAIGALNATAGGVALPVDDVYTVGKSWPSNDYAYFVKRGWCNVVSEASTMNLGAHNPIASDNVGCVNGAAAAAGETVLGIIDQASTAESTEVRCWIDVDLKPSEAAG